VTDLTGNRDKGHALFLQNCATCHRLRDEGNAVGPDLGTVATKPVQELVVAILDPNQAVDPAYTSYSVATKDDRDLTGILVSETPNSIVLRSPGGSEETVLRANIQDLRTSGRSLMPEGFETVMKPQDVADLIAYVLAR
jgi:putative heme-binding domain-containing protein